MTRKYPTTILPLNNEKIYANIVSKREFNDILHDKDETLGLGLDDAREYLLVNKLVHGEYDTFWACPIHEKDPEELALTDEVLQFDQFMLNLGDYVLYNSNSSVSDYVLYRKIQECIFPSKSTSAEEMDINKLLLYCFFDNEWRAFFEDVLNSEYKYMNVCDLVRDHINKFFG